MRSIIASCLVSIIILTSSLTVHGDTSSSVENIDSMHSIDSMYSAGNKDNKENKENKEGVDIIDDNDVDAVNTVSDEELLKNEVVMNVTPGIDDLDIQLDKLYKEVGSDLKIDYMYVKILHLLAGGKAVYADKRPNIYSETTVEYIDGPFDIDGANTNYTFEAPWAYCPDPNVERPSKYYLPDSAYNVTKEIVQIMNERYRVDRGDMQPYFDVLKKDVRNNILFTEAVLKYTGSTDDVVDRFHSTYEKIIYDKNKNENVVEIKEDGEFAIKEKFKETFMDNGIESNKELKMLSIVLSFDRRLSVNNNPDNLKNEYVLPYKIGHTSRENIMIAAMSVIGKVRYVWGGGHLTSGMIKGINPIWKKFFDTYGKEEGEDGFNECIQPKATWCPVHGMFESTRNSCLNISRNINSIDEYIDIMEGIISTEGLKDKKFRDLMNSGVNMRDGIIAHRLDGLDCSGYTSWLFSQVDTNGYYDSGATAFIGSSRLRGIEYGNKMLPGDVFSWGSHIVFIVGGVGGRDKVYVMTESSPNMVKFGVIYYEGASSSDIDRARKIAIEANKLIGDIGDNERTHTYFMGNLGYREVEDEEEEDGIKRIRYVEIGRLRNAFIDEDTILPECNKKMKDMSAEEIIQYTINKMPEQYVSGLQTYDGQIFDTSKFNRDKKRDKLEGIHTDASTRRMLDE